MPVEPPMTKPGIHEVLQSAWEKIGALYGHIDGVSTDTAFAIGEAMGVLSKAKALLGRDIDNEKDGT